MATISSALSFFPFALMEPILALRLTDFDLTTVQIGIFFAIWPIFFITSTLIAKHLPSKVDRRVTLMLSALLSGMIFVFVGPSELASFEESLVLMGIGQSLVGVFSGFMIAPALSEMATAASCSFPDLSEDPELARTI